MVRRGRYRLVAAMADVESPPPDGSRRPTSGAAVDSTASLTPRVVGGLKWKLIAQVASEGTRVIVAVILARLLTPDEFGLAGMAFVVAGLVSIVADPWLGAAIVQRTRITERDRSTIFWMSVGLGVGTTTVSILLAPAVASFFGQPEVSKLFAVAALGFTIQALATTHASLLTRELAYRSLEIRAIAGTVAGGITAVIIALAGGGPWAIVGSSLATATVSTVLLWVFLPWRPHFLFSRASFDSLAGYTVRLFGSRVLGYANVSADNLMVGRFLGPSALGAYALAYNVMFTPMIRIAHPLQEVLFPAFSTLQGDNARLEAAWLRSKRLAAATLTPLFMVMVVIAPDFVPVVFGSKWDAAIPVLQLLCIGGVAYSLGTLNWSLLMAVGRVGTLLRLNIVVTTVLVVAYAVGLFWGIVGVAALGAAARWALVLPETWIATRSTPISFWRTMQATLSPLPAALVASIAAALLRVGLSQGGVPPAARIVLVTLVLLGLYVLLIWLLSSDLRGEIRRSADARLPQRLRRRSSG